MTFTEEVSSVRQTSSSIKSVSDKHETFQRIIANLKSMSSEEQLDIVQRNALHLLRSSMKREEGEEGDNFNPEHSLAMFSLAAQISAESVYLGMKPDSLFSTILSMYHRAVDEYNLTMAKLADESETSPVISDLTKLLAAEYEQSAVLLKVCPALV